MKGTTKITTVQITRVTKNKIKETPDRESKAKKLAKIIKLLTGADDVNVLIQDFIGDSAEEVENA